MHVHVSSIVTFSLVFGLEVGKQYVVGLCWLQTKLKLRQSKLGGGEAGEGGPEGLKKMT